MGIGEALSPHRIIAPRASRVKGDGIRGLPTGPGAPPLPGNPGPLLDAARERGQPGKGDGGGTHREGVGNVNGKRLAEAAARGGEAAAENVNGKAAANRRRLLARGARHEARGTRHARGAGAAAANSSPGHKGGR